jgi:hypothetical protein
MSNPYYKGKTFEIVPCFNIWNIMDNNGEVYTQCDSLQEAKQELKFFRMLTKEAEETA